MKNIVIATVVGLVLLFVLGGSGINGFLLTLIMAFAPVFIYSKLTNYQTKPFILASLIGLVISFLSYFILQIIGVMFGFNEVATLNMAYTSGFMGLLVSILAYRKLNKAVENK